MPRKTPQKSQVKSVRPLETMVYGLDTSDVFATQLSSDGKQNIQFSNF